MDTFKQTLMLMFANMNLRWRSIPDKDKIDIIIGCVFTVVLALIFYLYFIITHLLF